MTIAPPTPPTHATPRSGVHQTVVMGDSTTLAVRTRTRWQRLRWPVSVVLVLVVVVGLMSLLQARTSTTPFGPDNAHPNGARALAQILQDQGVDIRFVRSLGAATSAATEDTTLLVVGTSPLWDDDIAALQPDEQLEHDALADARAAHDRERLARVHVQVQPRVHDLGSERLDHGADHGVQPRDDPYVGLAGVEVQDHNWQQVHPYTNQLRQESVLFVR